MNLEFQVHRLNAEGMSKAKQIATVFDTALEQLLDLVPAGRNLAIVRTKLEEACFFAKKGMASAPTNQEPER